MDDRGFTVLETIVSMFILSIVLTVFYGFKGYLASHEANVVRQEAFYTNIDSELAEIYSEEWSYNDRSVDTGAGEMLVSFRDLGESEFDTEVLEVSFSMRDLERVFEIERSIHYDGE